MDFDGLEIIKYKGTNSFFIALCKIKKDYYIFVSKAKPPNINVQSDILYGFDRLNLEAFPCVETYSGSINIDILVREKDNTLFSLFKLNNEKEFDTISEILGYYL